MLLYSFLCSLNLKGRYDIGLKKTNISLLQSFPTVYNVKRSAIQK